MVVFLISLAPAIGATVYDVTTFAGTMPGSQDGKGSEARFFDVEGLAIDANGAVYAADTRNHTIRRIAPDGTVSTVLGSARLPGSIEPASTFALRYPHAVAIDQDGRLYAGFGAALNLFNPDRSYRPVGFVIHYPTQAAVAGDGTVYLPNWSNHQVLSFGSSPLLAGAADGTSGSTDGAGSAARFSHPWGIALAPTGMLYVADAGNSTIRRIDTDGNVTTFAGTAREHGVADGVGAAARFTFPDALGTDAAGNVYVADSTAVRKITPARSVSTLAGVAREAGSRDGVGTEARFYDITGLTVDPDGTVYVSDNSTVRRIGRDRRVTTIAGVPRMGTANGPAAAARFTNPVQLALGPGGTLYVGDLFSPQIRQIAPDGTVSLFVEGTRPDPNGGPAIELFQFVSGLAIDRSGNVFVSSSYDHTIHKITAAGVISTYAGQSGVSGSANGTGTAATFNSPGPLATDAAGNLYVADTQNRLIRKITPGRIVSTLAGGAEGTSRIDGKGAAASFEAIGDLTIDAAETLWVSDGRTVRKITLAGDVTTAWSFGPSVGENPILAIAPSGDVILAGATANVVTVASPTGMPKAIIGRWGESGAIDGRGAAARFNYPRDIVVGSGGEIYVADSNNSAIRRITSGAPHTFDSHPQSIALRAGGATNLSARVTESGAAYAWLQNGITVSGANGSTVTLTNLQPAKAGIYTAAVGTGPRMASSNAAIVGVTSAAKVIGTGRELTPANLVHPNGNVFDQVLLTGAAESITADYTENQITRTSFIDRDDDIVQVEFSGPGTLTLVMADAGAPAPPVHYNQPVDYVKGHAGIVIVGADERTQVSVFSVGRATAFDPTGAYDFTKGPSDTNRPENNGSTLFQGHAATRYDGFADIAYIAILSTNGKFGGVRAANARFSAWQGITGVYAPGVQIVGGPNGVGPLFVGDVRAYGSASAVLITGSAGDVRITGHDLFQDNGRPVQIAGITQLKFVDGSDSHGWRRPAQQNRAVVERDGQDVTTQVVVNPPRS